MRREKNEGGPPGGWGLQKEERKSSPRGRASPAPTKTGEGEPKNTGKSACATRKQEGKSTG